MRLATIFFCLLGKGKSSVKGTILTIARVAGVLFCLILLIFLVTLLFHYHAVLTSGQHDNTNQNALMACFRRSSEQRDAQEVDALKRLGCKDLRRNHLVLSQGATEGFGIA